MRAAPPIVVTVARFGVWRGLLAALWALTAAVLAAWVVLRLELAAPWPASSLAAVLAGGIALGLSKRPAVRLRWDGRVWIVDDEERSLEPAIDAGAWMLLRLRRPGARPRTLWLPVQRRGLEASWHALRAAVYSPRPMSDAAAAPGLSNSRPSHD